MGVSITFAVNRGLWHRWRFQKLFHHHQFLLGEFPRGNVGVQGLIQFSRVRGNAGGISEGATEGNYLLHCVGLLFSYLPGDNTTEALTNQIYRFTAPSRYLFNPRDSSSKYGHTKTDIAALSPAERSITQPVEKIAQNFQ